MGGTHIALRLRHLGAAASLHPPLGSAPSCSAPLPASPALLSSRSSIAARTCMCVAWRGRSGTRGYGTESGQEAGGLGAEAPLRRAAARLQSSRQQCTGLHHHPRRRAQHQICTNVLSANFAQQQLLQKVGAHTAL